MTEPTTPTGKRLWDNPDIVADLAGGPTRYDILAIEAEARLVTARQETLLLSAYWDGRRAGRWEALPLPATLAAGLRRRMGGMTWRAAAAEAGVSLATFQRAIAGKPLGAASYRSLVAWWLGGDDGPAHEVRDG